MRKSMKSMVKSLYPRFSFSTKDKRICPNFIPGQRWKLSICQEWLDEEEELKTITKIRWRVNMEDRNTRVLLEEVWIFYSTGSLIMSCRVSVGVDKNGIGVIVPKDMPAYLVEKVLYMGEDIPNLRSMSIIKQIGCDDYIRSGYHILSFEVI